MPDAGGAEVFEGFDEAEAEELVPEAVGPDAGGEGVFVGGEPFGELETICDF